ncbi:IclR family transcriptional regulator [Actinocorallia sp. API 0066]|uniref:IclR family transcriptional regulator n=1 Tax=Actinocorallia sp. API 0066 TaxID=2896846 RepID=UPI001E464927|nr:IclR family transcriptional regulator [Actinocorallia sp. API 0066]MCD0453459.1 IclR family transcriptional regulator [Actinocorallia sp. API 0066]
MPGPIQSLTRAAAILRLLAGGERQLALGDVALTLGLAKGTVHGILRTLQQEGFVEQDPVTGRYQLGAELLRLGNSYLDVHELRARSLMWADDLARLTGESVRIGVLHQGGVLVIHHVFRPDDSRQVLEVGSMLPLHATAWGKVLLAFDPVAHGDLEAELKPYTRRTLVTHGDVDAECERIRGLGWAGEREEAGDGLASIAAPIRDRRGSPLGAVGVGGAVERLTEDGEFPARLVAAVRDTARSISRDLGATLY